MHLLLCCRRTGLHRQVVYGGLRIGLYEPVSTSSSRGGGCRQAQQQVDAPQQSHTLSSSIKLACVVRLASVSMRLLLGVNVLLHTPAQSCSPPALPSVCALLLLARDVCR